MHISTETIVLVVVFIFAMFVLTVTTCALVPLCCQTPIESWSSVLPSPFIWRYRHNGPGGGITGCIRNCLGRERRTATHHSAYHNIGGGGDGGSEPVGPERADDLAYGQDARMGADTGPSSVAGSTQTGHGGGSRYDEGQKLTWPYERYYQKTTVDKSHQREGERNEQTRSSDPVPSQAAQNVGDSSGNAGLENPFGDHAESGSLLDASPRLKPVRGAITRSVS